MNALRTLITVIALGALFASSRRAGGQSEEAAPTPSFRAIDMYVDSGDTPLAAYQIELSYDGERMKIVSLEGGATEGFKPAPHYDRKGLKGGRLIIAAFTSTDALAIAGRQRVARVHLMVEDGTDRLPSARLVTAARPGGVKIAATVTLTPATASGEEKEGR